MADELPVQTTINTDSVYNEAIRQLGEKGEDVSLVPKQQILLKNDEFYGYLFTGQHIQLLWHAETHLFTLLPVRDKSALPANSEESMIIPIQQDRENAKIKRNKKNTESTSKKQNKRKAS